MDIQKNNKKGIIFTRYLYLKDEVKAVLLMSLSDKRDSAVFWAYELYYSGFEEELFEYLFQIYYDFYYVLNPGFQDYFIKKYKEWKKDNTQDIVVSLIVHNLLSRPHNSDIFILRTNNYDNDDTNKTEKTFSSILETADVTTISHFVLSLTTEMDVITTLESAFHYFSGANKIPTLEKVLDKFIKTLGYLKSDKNIQLLAWILHQLAVQKKLTMGKNMYVIVEPYDILMYETIYKDDKIKAHHILPIACMYAIGEHDYLSLFSETLERNKIPFEELQNIYWYQWLYYASFSPVWLKRIETYKGKIDHEKECVHFSDDEGEEAFYQQYGYEPDEQTSEVQERNIS